MTARARKRSRPLPEACCRAPCTDFDARRTMLTACHDRAVPRPQKDEAMEIKLAGSVPSRRVSPESFTGTVWQDPIIEAAAPARIRAAWVRFEPRARTAWHTHPLGQTLHVVSGIGRVQLWGEPVREIRAGDTVWIAPGEKHWHGAAPETTMVHLALQEHLDGSHVAWLEHVSDEQYDGRIG
jgi:quercetin dioxygenase-like cupin family protein